MPVRNRRSKKRIRYNVLKRTKLPLLRLTILSFVVVLLFILVGIFVKPGKWDGTSKLHMVVNKTDGNIELLVFDPQLQEIAAITIPGNTQVEVAGGLGIWKLGSVWELGKQENVDGELLARTLTKELSLPVFVWSESQAESLTTVNAVKLISYIIDPFKTNLTFKDKVKLAFFSIRTPNNKKIKVDLATSGYLKSTVLKDGEVGYVVTGKLPNNLLTLLVFPQISEKKIITTLVNKSGDVGIAGKMSLVVEVLGSKVVSFENEPPEDSGCEISGVDQVAVKLMADTFYCKVGKEKEKQNEIKITIGTQYLNKF